MELRIDLAGRIVVPKAIRQRFGFTADVPLEAIEQPNGLLLRRIEEGPAMAKENGYWVHLGKAEPGVDLTKVLESVRNERDEAVLGFRIPGDR